MTLLLTCFGTRRVLEKTSNTTTQLRSKQQCLAIFRNNHLRPFGISFGLAQEDYTAYKSDATVQGIGSFVKSTTENGAQQSATNTGGVLGTYRYYFNRHNGVEVNYGYNRILKSTMAAGSIPIPTNLQPPTFTAFLRSDGRHSSWLALAAWCSIRRISQVELRRHAPHLSMAVEPMLT